MSDLRVVIGLVKARLPHISKILADRCNGITVTGISSKADEIANLIQQTCPSVVFLDELFETQVAMDLVKAARNIALPAEVLLQFSTDRDKVFEIIRQGCTSVIADEEIDSLCDRLHEVADGIVSARSRHVANEYSLTYGITPQQLTEDDRELMRLLTRGYGNSSIAKIRSDTSQNVSKQIDEMMVRLNTRSRMVAVGCAVRNGWT